MKKSEIIKVKELWNSQGKKSQNNRNFTDNLAKHSWIKSCKSRRQIVFVPETKKKRTDYSIRLWLSILTTPLKTKLVASSSLQCLVAKIKARKRFQLIAFMVNKLIRASSGKLTLHWIFYTVWIFWEEPELRTNNLRVLPFSLAHFYKFMFHLINTMLRWHICTCFAKLKGKIIFANRKRNLIRCYVEAMISFTPFLE